MLAAVYGQISLAMSMDLIILSFNLYLLLCVKFLKGAAFHNKMMIRIGSEIWTKILNNNNGQRMPSSTPQDGEMN